MEIEIKGLDAIIKKVESASNMPEKANKILHKLCEIGKEEIEKAHSGVMGVDHILLENGASKDLEIKSDIKVDIIQEGNTHTVLATGYEFLFFEFGAGISRNPRRNWHVDLGLNPYDFQEIPVPLEIAPIGSYGKGHGLQSSWYYNSPYGRVRTGGYKAVHGFANAINRIAAETDDVIKEVMNEQT